jgi:uncharacterized SAM-binding protein YcdF (DUF218 family)
MNELVMALGVESWKPMLTSLVMPPVPLLLLLLIGARQLLRRPLLGWALMLPAMLGVWFSCTAVLGSVLVHSLIQPPPALTRNDLAELRRSPKTAIIVLGGGRRLLAPEYGLSTLNFRSVERLRYGVWLSRETGLPLGFSGGVGHGGAVGASEAEIAARVAEREFNRPLRWQEGTSRDTRENAQKTVALLQPQGIEKIVLVTDALHMPRALANFERAAAGQRIRIVAAPMNASAAGHLSGADWLPSLQGYEEVWLAMHEALGRWLGA